MNIPRWEAKGIVTEARPLETKDKKSVWAYAVKIACAGLTVEATTKDKPLFDLCGDGLEVACTGGFEMFNNAVRFTLKTVNGKTAAQATAEAAAAESARMAAAGKK